MNIYIHVSVGGSAFNSLSVYLEMDLLGLVIALSFTKLSLAVPVPFFFHPNHCMRTLTFSITCFL